MKVSLNWLREFVELPSDNESIAQILTMAGVEVEGIEQHGVSIDKVVVAQILESTQHPNADRLSVCRVDDGSGQPRQIVCGAKNYKIGDKVPLALPGAVLPGDFKIKVGKLRGVESEGMMCSAKELQLAQDAEGLLILPPDLKTGTPLSELYPGDTIFDLEITPNRPDLLSHYGMAREISVLTGKSLKPLSIEVQKSGDNAPVISIEAAEQCPYYTARRISGVEVKPSPDWLKQKLEAVGLRAINNVVDITNYVMFELGQPLHAFDAAKVQGGIGIRMAGENEEFLALDGKSYKLNSQNLVIADGQKAIALGGVMGGEDSGVKEQTRDIILESAYFQPSNIRRTARETGLSSDSSYRFERKVDPAGVIVASQRAADLIIELAGGKKEGLTEAGNTGIENPVAAWKVSFRYERCAKILGLKLDAKRVDTILEGFGLRKLEGNDVECTWGVPSFRSDLTREIDLIEEICRVVGIESIPVNTATRFVESTAADHAYDAALRIRRRLVEHGFCEARTLSLIAEKAVNRCFFKNAEERRVRNPLNEEQVVLRPSCIPGLLDALANSVRVGVKSVRLFELGRVFAASETEEKSQLALVMAGPGDERSWQEPKPSNLDFYDLKGVIELLGFTGLEFRPVENKALAIAVEIFSENCCIGFAGQLWPAEARQLDVTTPVYVAEIDLSKLPAAQKNGRAKYVPIEKFPVVTRDIAMIAPVRLAHAKIENLLRGAQEPLLANVELFDIFTDPSGEKIPADKKSLAYSLTYRANDRTLTLNEVNEAHARLKERLGAELEVQFRDA